MQIFKSIIFISIFQYATSTAIAQDSSHDLSTGFVYQKSLSMYNESGFTIEYGNKSVLQSRLHLAISITSTRLGSAIKSNALKQENYVFSCIYIFRHSCVLSPLIIGNLGLVHVNFESPLFSEIQNTAQLTSLEFGLRVSHKYPLCANASLGYNFITGNGEKGVGTVVPFFYRLGIQYKLFR
jgi:hypothetical protein